MGHVMLGIGGCSRTYGHNEQLGTHRGRRGERSAHFVMMNMRALVMFCVSVKSTIF